jgi:hypothetical protein
MAKHYVHNFVFVEMQSNPDIVNVICAYLRDAL